MSFFMKKALHTVTTAVLIILVIDFLATSHHFIAITLIAVVLGISMSLAYDLGAQEAVLEFGVELSNPTPTVIQSSPASQLYNGVRMQCQPYT